MSTNLSCNLKYHFFKELFCIWQSYLPLRVKILSEAFVYTNNGNITGMISVKTANGNCERINIKRLLFGTNDYIAGRDLVNYIISYYGQLGAKSFKVVIDNKQEDLEHLFVNGCGFRCGSWENLWDITYDIKRFDDVKPINFKTCGDAHASKISELVNGELLTYYKPTLEQKPEEFKSPLLKVFSSDWLNSYVLIRSKNAVAYLTIQTNDNKNFVITLIKNNGYKLDYDRMISFALKTIKSKRNSEFRAYLRQQKCYNYAKEYEEYLHAHGYECVQTQHVLVKDFYRPVKEEYKSFIFSEGGLIRN